MSATRKNRIDLTGQKFGKLTVLKQDKPYITSGGAWKTFWICQCECGNYVHANVNKLKTGYTRSCGCLRVERIKELNRKYTITDKRLYGIYKSMIDRCHNKQNDRYTSYGSRGIIVCDAWLGEYGYEFFSKWAIENGYDENAKRGECTLDRIDTNGNYEPDNCRWITNKEQQNNKRTCRYIEHNGEIKTISQWAEYFGISYSKAYRHLGKQNRTVQELIDNYLS